MPLEWLVQFWCIIIIVKGLSHLQFWQLHAVQRSRALYIVHCELNEAMIFGIAQLFVRFYRANKCTYLLLDALELDLGQVFWILHEDNWQKVNIVGELP